MELNSIILYAIVGVVLIGLPAVIAKRSGKNLTEILFGKRAKSGFVTGRKQEAKDSAAVPKKQTNSNRNDMLDLISKLATYARRNRFRLIVPGTLSCGGETAVLTALLITRSKVVGINCFGFGGRVIGKTGEEDWEQVMNGQQSTFPSPVKKNRKQEALVRRVLEETGYPDTETEIIGVFTSPSVWASGLEGTNCYRKEDALKYLKSDSFLQDGGIDPKALEEALEPRIVRAKKQTETKTEADESPAGEKTEKEKEE